MATGTRAPSTIVTINLSGQTEFNIPFEYLARKFVVVTLLGVDRKVLTLNTDYRFVGKTVISLANPTPAGYTQLELRRNTSASERLVDFYDGSILRAYDLNVSQLQTLHVAEEARDSVNSDSISIDDNFNLDARNKRIVNLARGLEGSNDAVNMAQLAEYDHSTLNNRNVAELAAIRSEFFAKEALHATDKYGVTPEGFYEQGDTNDIQAIQRAMDYCAANNKNLCLTRMYDTNFPLIWKGNGFFFPKIVSSGPYCGLRKTSPSKSGLTGTDAMGVDCDVDAVIVVPAITNQPKTVNIERVHLMGTTTYQPDYGVYTTQCETAEIDNVYISRVGIGIYDGGSWLFNINNSLFRDVNIGGIRKANGTSTHINRCYVDRSGQYGFWLRGGYSGIHNSACDYSKTSAFIIEGPDKMSGTDATFEITNCGSENSGSNSVIKTIGATSLSVRGFTAFNWSNQQVPTPNALLEINTDYGEIELSNIRYVSVAKVIQDNGQQNNIVMTNVTSRESIPLGNLHINTKVTRIDSNGVRFFRGYDTTGIGFGIEDITDSNTATNWCGLRNKKVLYSGSVSVTRETSKSSGKAVLTLPFDLQGKQIAVTPVSSSLESFELIKPLTSVVRTGNKTFDVLVCSASDYTAWNNVEVSVLVYGVK